MQLRSSLIFWGILWFLLPGLLVAEDASVGKSEASFSLEQLLADSATATPEELWERVVRSDFELSSLSERPKGYFEFYAFSPGKGRVGTWQGLAIRFDDRENRRVVLFPGDQLLPSKIGINEHCLSINESGEWELRRQEGWAIAFDKAHVSNISDQTGLPRDRRGFIKFGLGSFLTGIMAPEVPDAAWEASTRTLVARKSNGVIAQVQFRTPNDQRRFGTALGELALRSSNDGWLSHRCFIVDRESPLRLNLVDIDTLPERLRAVDMTSTSAPLTGSLLDTPEEHVAALRLEEEIGYLTCETVQEYSPVANPLSQGAPAVTTVVAGEHVTLVQQAGPPTADAFVDLLVEQYEKAYVAIESAITKESPDPLIDDPSILWLGFERAISPRLANTVLDSTVSDSLASEHISLAAKIRLCMVIGEFGAPAWTRVKLEVPAHGDRFFETILHARWNWVPTADELALCHARLDDEETSALEQEAAIDSLIRWGKLQEVDPEQLDNWFEAKLAATDTHRHCTWKALTRTPSGRAFLTDRLDSLAARPQIQREVATMLHLRATATLDTKRFDFMTEGECRQTLRVCEILDEKRGVVDQASHDAAAAP